MQTRIQSFTRFKMVLVKLTIIDVFFTAPWVKVYLVSGKRCLAKAKTAVARRTLDPLYQQQLVFHEKYTGCVLQVLRSLRIRIQ